MNWNFVDEFVSSRSAPPDSCCVNVKGGGRITEACETNNEDMTKEDEQKA